MASPRISLLLSLSEKSQREILEKILAASWNEVVEEPKAKTKSSEKKKVKLVWHVMEEEQEKWINHHIEEKAEQNDGSTTITHEAPANFTMPLLNYQKEWLAWALNQENSYVKGGILADEMGLGKTVQAIALVLAKRESGCGSELSFPSSSCSNLPKIKSTLIVCSAGAVTRWVKEIESCTIKGSVKVLAYTGDKRAKYSKELSDFDFVVTSYSTVLTDCKNCNMDFVYYNPNKPWSHSKNRPENKEVPSSRAILHSFKWERIILDEALIIKNINSQTTRCIRALESSYRWALTDTHMRNRETLHSFISFLRVYPYSYIFCTECNCESVGPREWDDCKICNCENQTNSRCHWSWWKIYVDFMIEGRLPEKERAMILLQHKVKKDVMLRRTKKGRACDVILPSKTVVIRWDILDSHERENYGNLLREAKEIFSDRRMGTTTRALPSINGLRQAFDHPYIGIYSGTNAKTSDGTVDDYADKGECSICHNPAEEPFVAPCTHVFCEGCLMEGYPNVKMVNCPSCFQSFDIHALNNSRKENSVAGLKKRSTILDKIRLDRFRTSTKLEALREEIMFMIAGDGTAKGVVFSHFIPFLDLVQYTLMMSGVKFVLLGRSMAEPKRDQIVRQFTEEPECRILLSTMNTGGVALNLTAASHVFLLEPSWNRATEEQAQDRIHRIGQYRPVRIVRFIVKDTIEERIMRLQDKRGNTGAYRENSSLTAKEVKYLFK